MVWLFSGHQFQAQKLNKDIFETIYYHALKASSEIAAREGPYETYEGSPVSKVCWVSSNANTSSAVAWICCFLGHYFPFQLIKSHNCAAVIFLLLLDTFVMHSHTFFTNNISTLICLNWVSFVSSVRKFSLLVNISYWLVYSVDFQFPFERISKTFWSNN